MEETLKILNGMNKFVYNVVVGVRPTWQILNAVYIDMHLTASP